MRKKQNEYNKLIGSVLPFCCDLFLALFLFVCLLVLIYFCRFKETFTHLKASQAAVFQLLAWRHRFIFCIKISSYLNSQLTHKSGCAARTRNLMPSDIVTQNSKQPVITSRAKTFLCRRLKRKPQQPNGKKWERIPHPNAGAPTSGG